MTWGQPRSFPRAILHVDGDSFFAAVEVAKDPRLRGKPVITGKERGIVSACTYDLKRRGVKRGMRLDEARKIAPDAIVRSSDYETYSLFAERVYNIVRRYSPVVEEYSIDECFADLTGMRRVNRMRYEDMAHAIKRALLVELGMTFSVGLSATKVLAKLGSRFNKPDGFTVIPLTEAGKYLAKTPVGEIWGIGPNTAAYLEKFGIRTALEFARKDEAWVRKAVSKPFLELWRELNGDMQWELDSKGRTGYQSIQKTKTFTPPSRDSRFVYSQLSKNIENACIKARRWGLESGNFWFFLKTQEFKFHTCEIQLAYPTAVPHDILRATAEHYDDVFKKGTLYRSTGVTLTKLKPAGSGQLDLFGAVEKSQGIKKVFESVDELSEKYGKHVVYMGSSFDAMHRNAHLGGRGDLPTRTQKENLFKGETFRRRLNIPMWGEVT
jgi:DNA polymerase-4/DNA polymerase V